MALPNVSISFNNGQLGTTAPQDDGITGMIASGVAVAGKLALNTPYLLTSTPQSLIMDLAALGITSVSDDVNAVVFKAVNDFYTEAPSGTKLWLMVVAQTVTVEDMLDPTKTAAPVLINAANGAIKTLVIAKGDIIGYSPVIVNGLDGDLVPGMAMAQTLGNWCATQKYAPIFTILEGRHYAGTASALLDLTTEQYNRVAVMIGDTVSGSNGAAVGLLAGRIAAIPVQRSIARVKTGAVNSTSCYIGTNAAENGQPDVINGLGYITFRTFVGKAGYYFTDDNLATASNDDYALIPRRRVIDKAYRIAYQTLVNELSDEVPVTASGTIPPAFVKSIQNKVEVSIENNMTAYGNLGVDPTNANDTGVQCYINANQNIVQNSTLNVAIAIRPYGYAKYINVNLGFQVTSTVTI